MDLLSSLSASFENRTNQEEDRNRLLLFQLGEEADSLRRKRQTLCERLGEDVYHHRLEAVEARKEEIRQMDLEIAEYARRMEMLSDEI